MTEQSKMNLQEKEKENEKNNSANETKSAVAERSPAQKLVLSAKKGFESSNEYKMDFNREALFAVQILEQNTYLQKARPETIRNSVTNIALIGLSLNPALKYAYLVPRNSKDGLQCVLDISYIGMIKLLTDAGAVKSIDADIICENDKYDFRKGSESYLKHTVSLKDRGKPIGVYAIAYFRDGGSQFIVMSKDEVEKVRATSESWKNEKGRAYSPWETWTDEMWKKTALKRLFKLLPKTHFSEKLISAISHDYNTEIEDLPKEEKYDEIFDEVQDANIIE